MTTNEDIKALVTDARVRVRQRVLLAILIAGQVAAIVVAIGDHSWWSVLPFWWVSLLAAILLVARPSEWTILRRPLPQVDLVITCALTAIAGLLRIPNLERLPSGIHGDEGEFADAGLAIANGGGPPLFGVAFLDDPAAYPHMLAVFINLLGADMAAVRLPSAIVGTLTIPLFYALMRTLAGRTPAFIATFLLATSAVHIHFSRLAINVIEVPAFACLSLLCLAVGVRTQRNVCYLLAGLTGGMVAYFHFSGRLVAVVLAVLLFSQLLIDRRDARHWLGAIALAALGGLLSLSPFLAHLASRPELLTGHVAGRGIWNYWDTLAVQYGTTPSNKPYIIWEQIVATFAAFTSEPDPFRGAQFFRFMDAPLLTPLIAGLALAGLAALCLNPRSFESRLLLVWFLVPVILASALTDTAGQAHRLIHPLLPALAAAALLIDRLLRAIPTSIPQPAQRGVAIVFVTAVLASGVWDGSRYFEPWRTERIAPAHTAQARCLEALPAGSIAYIAGAPLIRADHGPSRYLGDHVIRNELGDELPGSLDGTGSAVVILLHEWNRDQIDSLRQQYADLVTVEIERPPGKRALTVVGFPGPGHDIDAILDACLENAGSDPDGR